MNLQLSCYEAERGLLRIFCQHTEVLGLLTETIIPEYFMDINRIIFLAVQELYRAEFAIDIITIKHTLERLKDGNRVPESAIIDLFNTEDKDTAETYLAILVENYQARNYQSMVVEMSEALKDRKSTGLIAEIIGKYVSNITLGASRPKSIEIVIDDCIQETKETALAGESSKLLNFGVSEIDRVDTMRPGNLYIIAARPGSGKTSLMIQAAYYNAFIKKKRVVIFSLEMSEDELLEKIYCRHIGINSETWLRIKPMVRIKEMQIFKAYIVAQGIDLLIDEKAFSIDEIVLRTSVLTKQKHIDLVCVDYVQLVQTSNNKRSKHGELLEIMNTLKVNIAKKQETAIILLSQISKSLEKEGHRIPTLADLRESGSIEDTGTSVYFLHQVDPSIRLYFDERGEIKNDGQTLVVIQKARFGEKGIVQVWFAGGVNIFVKTKQERDEIVEKMNTKCRQLLERTE